MFQRFFGNNNTSKKRRQSNTKNKPKTDTNNWININSDNGHSQGGASNSIAEGFMFPMQYNGPTYDFQSFPDELIFIPFRKGNIPQTQMQLFTNKDKKINHKYGISALLIHGNPKNHPTHFMILFHGNGCDLGMASAIWRPLIRSLPIHLLIVEYPGYGIMNGRCACHSVINVSEHVYDFVTSSPTNGGLGIPTNKLIILGRSIGTGPASHIAKKACRTLILVSPFSSINDLSKDLLGKRNPLCWILPKDYNLGLNTTRRRSCDAEASPESSDDGGVCSDNSEEPIPSPLRNSKSMSNLRAMCVPSSASHDADGPLVYVASKTMSEHGDHSVVSIENEQFEEKTRFGFDSNDVAIDGYPAMDADDTESVTSVPSITDHIQDNYLGELKEEKASVMRYPSGLVRAYTANTPNMHDIDNDNGRSVNPKYHISRGMSRSESNPSDNKSKKRKKKSKNQPKVNTNFVFNNVCQIGEWKCSKVIIFHGKRDELIPHSHSLKLKKAIASTRNDIEFKLHLMDGVGHNDVNIQYLGLRIFMEFGDELNTLNDDVDSDNNMTNLDEIVPFLDDPPSFNIEANKVTKPMNYNEPQRVVRNKYKQSKISKLMTSSSDCVNSSDDDDDDPIINEQTKYLSNHASRVFDLHRSVIDAKRKQHRQDIKRIAQGTLF